MEKIAIIMTVHNNIEQLHRLCKSLECENIFFYIHVDKKSNLDDFKTGLKDIKNAYIYSEVKVYWADLSQVDATISLLKLAVKDNCDYIYFISGVDVLIDKQKLFKYAKENKNYMEVEALPNKNWGTDGRCNRYKFYHNIVNNITFIKFNPRNRYYMFINSCLIKLQKIFKTNRQFIKGYNPYSGANWFNINIELAKYIISMYPKTRKYFKFVQFPDEMYVQSIVMNSKYKNTINNKLLRYVDWVTGPEEPRILTYEDYEKIINSDNIFARKLDYNKDTKLFDLLDDYRKEKK